MGLEFQKAVIAALRSDWQLAKMVRSIRDKEPSASDNGDNSAFPFITYAQRLREFDTDDSTGFDVKAYVNTWSRTGGKTEAQQIQAHVYRILHNKRLTVDGSNLVLLLREDSSVDDDPDGITVHGVCEYQALLDHTSNSEGQANG